MQIDVTDTPRSSWGDICSKVPEDRYIPMTYAAAISPELCPMTAVGTMPNVRRRPTSAIWDSSANRLTVCWTIDVGRCRFPEKFVFNSLARYFSTRTIDFKVESGYLVHAQQWQCTWNQSLPIRRRTHLEVTTGIQGHQSTSPTYGGYSESRDWLTGSWPFRHIVHPGRWTHSPM